MANEPPDKMTFDDVTKLPAQIVADAIAREVAPILIRLDKVETRLDLLEGIIFHDPVDEPENGQPS